MNYKRMEPAFAGNNQCIVFSANASFLPLTAVAIQSIIETSRKSSFYDIIILHKNMAEFDKSIVRRISENLTNISIRFYNMAEVISGDTLYTENRKTLTEESYYRLYIPWILSEEYEKAVYLDSDMILLEDIAPLFYVELGQNLLAAVRDYWGICNCYIPGDPRKDYRLSIGLTDLDNYVISGTLIFNLPLFRKRYKLSIIKSYINQREWQQHDQDVINVLCQGSILYLDPKWSWMSDYGNNHYLPEYLRKELADMGPVPAIVHFGGGRKPYLQQHAEFSREFWNYADHTPFFSTLLKQTKSYEHKSYVVYHLLKKPFDEAWTTGDIERSYKGVSLGSLSSDPTRYRSITIKNNTLYLEGMLAFYGVPYDSNVKVFVIMNGTVYPAVEQNREDGFHKEPSIGLSRGEAFRFKLPLNKQMGPYTVQLIAELNGLPVIKKNLRFEKYCALGSTYKNCYSHRNGWIISADRNGLRIEPASQTVLVLKELAFLKELWHKKRYNSIVGRILYHALNRFIRKPIWLVSDRLSRADDNGQAFFRFLRENKKDQISAYFVMDQKCEDFQRLKQYGPVVPAYSYKHKILHLLADYSISSQTDEVFRNPFGPSRECYRDILSKTGFVFLQHGIIKNDLRNWLHNRRQQMTGFITSTEAEYEAILHGGYGYSEDQVWLTGMARFDRLTDASAKVITVLPTWRMYLATRQNHATGVWELKNNFSQSAYATFYRNLMNNSHLRQKAKELGYTIQFRVHPAFITHEDKFYFDTDVCLIDPQVSYRDLYATSSLIVTDYSSSINDFAYLRKPVIYTQFDHDEFFSGNHIYTKGDYDYERDGFGEVEYTLEDTIDRIIEYMENGCVLKDKYRTRIDHFFAFNDRNNCQRIYEKILESQHR